MKCTNHPEKEALGFCHSCGEHFCKECLTEGIEYYYCEKEECQERKSNELNESTEEKNAINKRAKEKRRTFKIGFYTTLIFALVMAVNEQLPFRIGILWVVIIAAIISGGCNFLLEKFYKRSDINDETNP